MDSIHQKKILHFFERNRRMPSYKELLLLTEFSSRSSVFKLTERLSKEGFLSKDSLGKLIPGKNWNALRILGVVEAGFPSPAEESRGDYMSLDEYLIPHRDASYLLTVKGDSMKDAGIIEGDTVIVERGKEPKIGQIVIAQVDGAWTMKYYRTKNGKPYLEPANTSYKPIYPKNELKIEAIVRAVIRKY